jgi:hypothetical protein
MRFASAALCGICACSSPERAPVTAPMTAAPTAVAVSPASQRQGATAMDLDSVLQSASSSAFADYDPTPVIAAVNALLPLGKAGALDAMDAFLARQDLAADPHRGLFLVLRVAFEAEPHPPLQLGGSQPAPPPSASALPRFPIMLVSDVPIMLVANYTLRGLAEPVSAHVAYYRANGTLRSAPLAPLTGPDRLADYQAQYQTAYHAQPSAAEREHVRAQLARWKP